MSQRNTILLADDMSSNRSFLRRIFEDDYEILEAENGEETLKLIRKNKDRIAVVLLDLVMPDTDGYQVLAEMGESGFLQEIPVIVVTSDSSQKSEARILELGALDLVAKPYDPYIIRRRVRNITDLTRDRRILTHQVDEMKTTMSMTNEAIVNSLASIMEFRSLESGQHIIRIQKFTNILLKEVARSFPEYELDEKKIETISSASVLHDIGKISIPDAILNKPGRLTSEEFSLMKTHTTAGCRLLEKMTNVVDRNYLRYAYNICRYHHERWDGKGYPDGLKGENIPLCAQVASIADVYDALTTKRVYKGAISHEETVNMILNGECGVFNPHLLECFKRVYTEFEECALEYKDGGTPTADDIQMALPVPKSITSGLNAQQLMTIKYHTLLDYIRGVVIEVDMTSGVFHLAYDNDSTFSDLLHGDGNFQKALKSLITKAVHPSDKERAWKHYDYLRDGFFEEGLRKSVQRFRVKSGYETAYRWYECVYLRLYTSNPGDKKVMIIWKNVEEGANRTENTAYGMPDERKSELRCRNDKWQTILGGYSCLTELTGYTAEEIAQDFHGRLSELLLPEDIEAARTRTQKQFHHQSNAETEFRLAKKDGQPVWIKDTIRIVMGDDGTEHAFHRLTDNSKEKEAVAELAGLRERHKILLSQLDDIVLEWNIATDTVVFSPQFKKLIGYEPVQKNFAQNILDGKTRIHPDDLALVQSQVRQIFTEQRYPSFWGMDFRIQKEDGTFIRRRLKANAQQKENGKIESFIGLLLDADKDSEDVASMDMASRDSLTKLLNFASARKKTEEYLSQRQRGERAAILILDLDQFKKINENYGRLVGDSVLMQSADLLKRMFSGNDIIARIGGDEFMILIKNAMEHKLLQTQCENVLEMFALEITKGLPDCSISCCIGAALAPEDGNTFEELFRRAEQALIYAQSINKPYAFYQQGLRIASKDVMMHTRIESDSLPGLANQSLVYYAFDQLYRSGDVNGTINSILEMIGKQMNVSRVYIYENSPDNKRCSNTFEWCNEGITPKKGIQQELDYEKDTGGWNELYETKDILLCEDISRLPGQFTNMLAPLGIKSMLQCAIRDGGKFRGFAGLDECVLDRTWTREQLDILQLLVKLTSVFLFKQRVNEESRDWGLSLVSILNHLPVWIYVIDISTCEILFSNTMMKNFSSQMKKGSLCYEVMMGRTEKCEKCPADGIRKKGQTKLEVFNKKFGTAMKTEAVFLNWSGTDAALIICEKPW